ncbi:hypothetical protein [Flavivirga sp. 57AJ16]|uniref:hypothetical protein n=1 Tax=Flavivirga sp. 57AJ16 TaxID=3025307 RepID=UPI0023672D6B|nr:hypothetical protein [Flavivirga sp. 57AJ16]MDD7885756.1 hypothetical protein [Flavivirga sp. 57AJ16]
MKYTGNKNIPGVIEFLINRLPKSERYFSLFMGGAGLENSVYTQDITFYCSEKDKEQWKNKGKNFVIWECYRSLIEDNVFTSEDFIFADPPYMISTRRSKKKIYKNEFTVPDHIEFLNYMISSTAKIMITHPRCDLYDEKLKDWSIEEFKYMTRGGIFHDALYTNYNPADIELMNYKCLGNDFTERQAIKRQRHNIIKKFKKMNKHKKEAIIIELKKNKLI